jgi:hypothetical protein
MALRERTIEEALDFKLRRPGGKPFSEGPPVLLMPSRHRAPVRGPEAFHYTPDRSNTCDSTAISCSFPAGLAR